MVQEDYIMLEQATFRLLLLLLLSQVYIALIHIDLSALHSLV